MHSEEPVVCIVIVTCNSTDVIEPYLESVAVQTRLPDRLVVIDNASTDGSSDETERVLERLPALAARATVSREAHASGSPPPTIAASRPPTPRG